MKWQNRIVLLLALGLISIPAFALHLSSDSGSPGAVLIGLVKGPGGEALEGVPVSARAEGETIATSVYTDQSGFYVFPPLHAGHYRLWTQAVGFQTARRELEIGSQRAQQDFSLKAIADFTPQLSAPEWMAALPEDTPADRRGKALLRNNCTGCHPASYILQNRFDEAGWKIIIDHMEKTSAYGERPQPDQPLYNPIMRYFKLELAAYLSRMRGPGVSPMKFRPFPRPRGDAAAVVVTEYDIPNGDTGKLVTADGSDWSEGTPSLYEARGPHDAVVDSRGIVWIATTDLTRTVTRLDPKTGQTRDIVLRDRRGQPMSSHGIAVDQNDAVWFNAGGGLGKINTRTEKSEWFEAPPQMTRVGGTIDVDPKGFVWAAANIGAIRFDPKTGQFTEFQSLDRRAPTYGVAADADGNGWWAQLEIGVVGRSDIANGKISQVVLDKLPVEISFSPSERKVFELSGASNNSAPPGEEGPRRLSGDKHSHFVWVGDWWGNNFARIDIRTNKVTYYPLPGLGASPFQIWGTYATDVDKNGMIWGNLQNYDAVARLDPQTESWTIYPLPTLGTESRFISVDHFKDTVEVWVPYWRTNKVARLQFRTSQQLQALRSQLLTEAR